MSNTDNYKIIFLYLFSFSFISISLLGNKSWLSSFLRLIRLLNWTKLQTQHALSLSHERKWNDVNQTFSITTLVCWEETNKLLKGAMNSRRMRLSFYGYILFLWLHLFSKNNYFPMTLFLRDVDYIKKSKRETLRSSFFVYS